MAASRKSSSTNQAGLPATEVVGFLRDTRSSATWSEKEFASALNLTSEQVKQTLPVLQLAGYIEPRGHTGCRYRRRSAMGNG